MTNGNDKGFWALKTGAVVERYRIEKVLGHGGFGITYLVTHTELGKQFALKEHFPRMFSYRDTSTTNIRASDDSNFNWTLDQFIAEGRSLAKCHHPNVTMVADVFRANGTAYMVLGFENGASLKNWLAELRRPPTQEEMDRLVFPLLDALKTVHAQGLLHRDIAADNIIIRADGTPCLIDFGAARQAVAERSMMMTAIIKSGYSPPEQYSRAGKGQGPWSDLYALGATLYFAVSGKMPAESTDRQMGEDLEPVEKAVANSQAYRSSFLQAINTCLNLKLADRFQSVDAMLADLQVAEVDRQQSGNVNTTTDKTVLADPEVRRVFLGQNPNLTKGETESDWRELPKETIDKADPPELSSDKLGLAPNYGDTGSSVLGGQEKGVGSLVIGTIASVTGFVVLFFLAFYAIIGAQGNLTDYDVCSAALNRVTQKWETSSRYQEKISEAKRRGFTASKCYSLIN